MYSIIRFISKLFCKIVFFVSIEGRENIPDGPVIIAANHTSILDAPMILLVTPRKIRAMGKAELFQNKFLGAILRAAGAFPVHRGTNDITAIKTALRTLKDGGVFAIFPTGTRVKSGDVAEAKSGVALIAAKSGAPIIPVAICNGYKAFRKVTIRIGDPMYIKSENGVKPSGDELRIYADLVLEKINALGDAQ